MTYQQQAYGGWCTDNEARMLSASGGAFTALAQWIFLQKGAVYGVVECGGRLVFRRAENMCELAPMHGSKYYQADITTLNISELLTQAKNSVQLMFTGTPCQVSMVRNYLENKMGEIPENVLLVDIICHGVGSAKVVNMHRHERESNANKLVRHDFRSKDDGHVGSQYSRYIYADGSVKITKNDNDYYMRLFFPNKILRLSCYCCKYAGKIRYTDITIGDFNGGRKFAENYPDNTLSISAILANSSKGKQVIEKAVSAGLLTLFSTDFSVIAKQNMPLCHPLPPPVSRKYVYTLLRYLGVANTARLLSWKYYIRSLLLILGGERLLNKIKKLLGRKIIEV